MEQDDVDRVYGLLDSEPDLQIQKLWRYLTPDTIFKTESMLFVPDWGKRKITVSTHQWSTQMTVLELQRIVRTHMVVLRLRERGDVAISEKEADDWRDLEGVRLEDLVRLGYRIPEPALERSAARMPGVRNDQTLVIFLEEEPPGTHEYLLSRIAAESTERSDLIRIGYNAFSVLVDFEAQTARVFPSHGPPTEMPLQEFVDRIS